MKETKEFGTTKFNNDTKNEFDGDAKSQEILKRAYIGLNVLDIYRIM